MCSIWWVCIYANTHTITKIKVMDVSNISQSAFVSLPVCVFVLSVVLRTANMRFVLLTNVEVHDTTLLTICTILYSRPLGLTHLAQLQLKREMSFNRYGSLCLAISG